MVEPLASTSSSCSCLAADNRSGSRIGPWWSIVSATVCPLATRRISPSLGRNGKKDSGRLSISSGVSGPSCWGTRAPTKIVPARGFPVVRVTRAGRAARGSRNPVTRALECWSARAALDGVRLDPPARDRLVHPGGQGATGGGLSPLPGILLGRPGGRSAVAAPFVGDADPAAVAGLRGRPVDGQAGDRGDHYERHHGGAFQGFLGVTVDGRSATKLTSGMAEE